MVRVAATPKETRLQPRHSPATPWHNVPRIARTDERRFVALEPCMLVRTLCFALLLLAPMLAPARATIGARAGLDWPSFRGIGAAGVSDGKPTPTTWDIPSGKGVKWKTAIPGLGHSSPIVWGNQVFVATATSEGGDENLKVGLYGNITPVEDRTVKVWKVICLDKKTGTVRWQRDLHRGVPAIKRHTKATHANSTLATDGTRIVAFLGSEGLHALDVNGHPLWKQDLGVLDSGFFRAPEAQWGFASSPVIHEGRVIVQADVQKGSFVAAFDIETGKELWRTPRADVPTWSTPAVYKGPGTAQVVVNGFKHAGGYDLRNGKEIWKLTGGGDIPVPTPLVGEGFFYLTSAHGPLAPIYAIKTTATGDISLAEGATSGEHVAWSQTRDGAYMQTPIVYRGLLYVCRDNGVLSVYDARTGERKYQQRLADGQTGFTASAVAADGKVYYTSEEGGVFVLKAGPVFELLAENALGEVAMATPAISEGTLFFRTRGHLVAIGDR
jgi:outer membrane protein assembly factor BamB